MHLDAALPHHPVIPTEPRAPIAPILALFGAFLLARARARCTPHALTKSVAHLTNLAIIAAFVTIGVQGVPSPIAAATVAAGLPAPHLVEDAAPVAPPAMDPAPLRRAVPVLDLPSRDARPSRLAGQPQRTIATRPLRRPDALCLALNLHHEARGEPRAGQIMVAHVTLNRTAVRYRGARTVCEVVFDPAQFSWTGGAMPNPDPEDLAPMRALARAVLGGRTTDRSQGALHYYNPHVATPAWRHAYAEIAEIGQHRFLR